MSWAAMLALLAAALTLGVLSWLLYRSRDSWPALPPWTWSDIRQGLALVGTVAGAAILTDLFWWHSDRRQDQLDWILRKLGEGKLGQDDGGGALASIGQTLAEGSTWDGKLLIAGVLAVILSLGFVIGRRKYKVKLPGGEAELGTGDTDDDVELATEPSPAADPGPDPGLEPGPAQAPLQL